MTIAIRPVSLPAPRQRASSAVARWMLTRGVLLALVEMPVVALILSRGLRLVSLPVAMFGVFASGPALTAWASYRITVSHDEPVHHLHRHVRQALGPFAVLTVAEAVMTAAGLVDLWSFWTDLGGALTGEPASSGWAVVGGAVLHCVAALSGLAGWFVLTHRRPPAPPASHG